MGGQHLGRRPAPFLMVPSPQGLRVSLGRHSKTPSDPFTALLGCVHGSPPPGAPERV